MPRTKSADKKSEIDRLGDVWSKVVENHKSTVDEMIFVKSIMEEWFDAYIELLRANVGVRNKRGRKKNINQEVNDGERCIE